MSSCDTIEDLALTLLKAKGTPSEILSLLAFEGIVLAGWYWRLLVFSELSIVLVAIHHGTWTAVLVVKLSSLGS